MSCQLCCGSHSSITVGHNLLDKFILLIQCHVADVMMKVTFSADVTGLDTVVAGLREGFEGPSVVDIYRSARGKCVRRGVHFCRGRGSGGMWMEE
jgi:hypothetical protein